MGPRGGDDDGVGSHLGDVALVVEEARLGDAVLVVEGDHRGNSWAVVLLGEEGLAGWRRELHQLGCCKR